MRFLGFPTYLFLMFVLVSCQSNSGKEVDDFELIKKINSASLELTGESLSNAYCGSCHLKPEPEVLDKKTWKTSVLPDMRRRLGMITADDFGVAIGEDNDAPAGVYATESLISRIQWDLIEAYYLENAPESLINNLDHWADLEELDYFELIVPDYQNLRPSLTTLVTFNEADSLIYLADRLNQLFKIDTKEFSIQDSIQITSAASDMLFHQENGFDLLTMGYMDPSNLSIGTLEMYEDDESSHMLLDSLRRPVHFSRGDLSGNGIEELVISNFGHHIGSLTWYEQTEEGYVSHDLNVRPGARKTILEDINGDGKLDIIALMTQAKEGVYAYINLGNGKFREENWLSFQPAFGASDFDWIDMDGDGNKELVIVNGDNADFSPILKPYHGIRIFKDMGMNQFEEVFFYPMNGASAMVIGEFSSIGKKDIAVISYFPSKEGILRNNFLYFEQVNGFDFEVKSFPSLGQWSFLTISKEYIYERNRADIILGRFDFQTLHAFPSMNWMPFVILRNKT
jgi:hypothetical protein